MNNIQSVERAFALLEAVAAEGGEGVMLSSLARRSGLKSSTASRLLCTLESLGYLEQPVAKKGYRLGARLMDLARGPLCPPELFEASRELLPRYVEASGEYICLSCLRGSTRVIVLRFNSTHEIQAKESPALVEENPFSSASGRLLLALLDDGRREFCLRQLQEPGSLWPEARSRKALLEGLAEIRAKRFASFSSGELATFAAPVEFDGELYALGSFVPRYRFEGEREAKIRRLFSELPAKLESAASRRRKVKGNSETAK